MWVLARCMVIAAVIAMVATVAIGQAVYVSQIAQGEVSAYE